MWGLVEPLRLLVNSKIWGSKDYESGEMFSETLLSIKMPLGSHLDSSVSTFKALIIAVRDHTFIIAVARVKGLSSHLTWLIPFHVEPQKTASTAGVPKQPLFLPRAEQSTLRNSAD